MTRITYIIKETFRNIGRFPGTALASVLSLTLLFLLFDLFWIASMTSEKFYDSLLSEIEMEIFLPEDLPDSSIADVSSSLILQEEIFTADYISKAIAREELERLVGIDLLIGYDSTNPLPRSFIAKIEPDFLTLEDMDRLKDKLQQQIPGTEIHYSRDWLQKAESTRSLILQVGLVLGLLILLATVLSSANSIRLMAKARAQGFHQMMLLGAGKTFVAMPFLIEGFLVTMFSTAAGWGILMYGRQKIAFTQFEIIYPVNDQIVAFCLIAGLLGAISGYIGVYKYLK